jgi:hypothetical protein
MGVGPHRLPRCDAASVALRSTADRRLQRPAPVSPPNSNMVQYDLHDGPCLTSFRTAASLRLAVVELDDESPHFAVAARKHDIASVLSMPALWGDDCVATLTLYSRTGRLTRRPNRLPRSSAPRSRWR